MLFEWNPPTYTIAYNNSFFVKNNESQFYETQIYYVTIIHVHYI